MIRRPETRAQMISQVDQTLARMRERESVEGMRPVLGAKRLARACGADRVVVDAIGGLSDPGAAERAANAVADRRWREAESPSAHAATRGQVAEGGAG